MIAVRVFRRGMIDLFTKLGSQEKVRVCKQEKENHVSHCENFQVQGSVQYPSKNAQVLHVPNNIP